MSTPASTILYASVLAPALATLPMSIPTYASNHFGFISHVSHRSYNSFNPILPSSPILPLFENEFDVYAESLLESSIMPYTASSSIVNFPTLDDNGSYILIEMVIDLPLDTIIALSLTICKPSPTRAFISQRRAFMQHFLQQFNLRPLIMRKLD